MSFRGEHTDRGLLLGNEKKRPADRCNSVNKPEMHSAKQKKPDSKGYLLLDSVVISIGQPSGIFCPPNEKTKQWFLAAGGGADYKGAHVFGGRGNYRAVQTLFVAFTRLNTFVTRRHLRGCILLYVNYTSINLTLRVNKQTNLEGTEPP